MFMEVPLHVGLEFRHRAGLMAERAQEDPLLGYLLQ